MVILVNRGGNGNNIKITVLYLLDICGAFETSFDCILEQFVVYFKSCIMSAHEGINALLIHVESNGCEFG